MARRKKDLMGGMINILVLVMLIPILLTALPESEDPSMTALMGILPIILIFNAFQDLF